MKARSIAILVLLASLSIISTWVVSAQGPKPTPTPERGRASPPPSVYPQGYGQSTTEMSQDWTLREPPLRAPMRAGTSQRAPRSPAVALGQPGLSYRYVQTFGVTEQAYTTDSNHLNAPSGLFIDGSNNVYVAEDMGYRLLRFDSGGTNTLSLGRPGLCFWSNNPTTYCNPQDMALDGSGKIWLAEGSRVAQYSSGGGFLQQVPSVSDINSGWSSGTDNYHFDRANGVAFDATGHMFVSDGNNHRVQVYDVTGPSPVYSATIGMTGVYTSTNAGFNYPRRLSVNGNGLYVADQYNNRVQRCNFSGGIWSCTTFVGSLNNPQGIGLDSSGNVYVANSNNNTIVRCNSSGTCNTTWIQNLPGSPQDVAIDSGGNVYVSDWNHAVVRKYDSGGIPLGVFVGTVDTPYSVDATRINTPSGIAVANDGSIYVGENNGQRLIKLNASGVQQWTVGQAGVTGGWNFGDNTHFNWPQGNLAIDAAGRVYVADEWNNRIQVYNPDHSFYQTFGSKGFGNNQFGCTNGVAISPVNGDIYVVDRCNQRVQVYTSAWVYKATLGTTGSPGNDGTHFNNPRGVAIDVSGNIYVADSDNIRVQKCTLSGSSGTCMTYLGQTNVQGNDFGHFGHPVAVALRSGRLFVVDEWNNRVQVFDASGAYLTTIGGSWGTKTGELRNPAGVAVDGAGSVYVTDRTNSRIQKFSLGVPGWMPANINGFGALNNPVVSALTSFGGQLYAGTDNNTVNGAQMWRKSVGGAWTAATTNGFGDPSNYVIDDMTAFNGYLYAGTGSWDYVNNKTLVGQVWRSGDGSTWNRMTLTGLDPTNGEILGLATFNNKIYASTASYTTTHGAEIWRSDTGDSGAWTRIMSNGFNSDVNAGIVPAMIANNGYLYATKGNFVGMAEVWRCSVCDGSDWNKVNTSGFDGSTTYTNTVAISLATFNGYLYAGTRNWTSGAQIWRCSISTSTGCDNISSSWSQVVGPAGATGSGFGNIQNGRIESLVVNNNVLYAITYNNYGIEVWRTQDGTNWQQVGFGGFGNSNNYAPYYSNSTTVFNNSLYIGTINWANGGQVWLYLGTSVYLPLIKR